MFLEIIIAIALGVTAGTFTGLIPGIHINLVSIMCVSISPFLLAYTSPIVLGSFIVAMAITHTFLDSIPSIFLGAPDPDMVMGVLPGHRLLLQGKGYDAVRLTVIGSLMCLILTAALFPLMIPVAPRIYDFLKPYIGYILVAVVLFMIIKENDMKKRAWGLFIFALSGTLGLIVLNAENIAQPLLPMLSGLFGVSTLLLSLDQTTGIPQQTKSDPIKTRRWHTIKALFGGTIAGSLTGLFPGLGAAQASIIGMQLVGKISDHAFMILVGGINTVNFLFSLVTFYTLDKARNGAIVAVQQIAGTIDTQGLLILLLAALITSGIVTWLAFRITDIFSRLITRLNYKAMVLSVIGLIILLVIIFSGWIGLIITLTATALGTIAPTVGVKRSHAMGCLLLPVMIFFLA
ncbi:hypothetical protein COV93_01020 [Candidatus Woesearchaeota archaeon CG11_big_fil_rev_8_21_14_0_20_43_8]|nr:MAG: hypothetical protein COV93_01020 [Candidatus Woesearchaeota archaeon CG11_big_fil_rev_8_21_14_0_20_43_8]PIO06855.1 MAG: hypothetical protein COT47_02470 [Candidatus Woesearchaeota archaeon CG08_land_8_20_14_0_20_43_7]